MVVWIRRNMFIKKRTIVILAVAVITVMIVEGMFVAFVTEASVVHGYHGRMNGQVGWPYADFVHQLRIRYEAGDTNALGRALRAADERSRDMFDVWLDDNRQDAYCASLHEILK